MFPNPRSNGMARERGDRAGNSPHSDGCLSQQDFYLYPRVYNLVKLNVYKSFTSIVTLQIPNIVNVLGT